MSKVIEVKNCGECPHISEAKCFCLHPAIVSTIKNIEDIKPLHDDIPDWCPLKDKDDFCESNFDPDRKF